MPSPCAEELLIRLLPAEYQTRLKSLEVVGQSRHPAALIRLQGGQTLFIKQLSSNAMEAAVLSRLCRYSHDNDLLVGCLAVPVYVDSQLLVTHEVDGCFCDKADLLKNLPELSDCLNEIHKAEIDFSGIPTLPVPRVKSLSYPLSAAMQQELEIALTKIADNDRYSVLLHGDLSKYNLFKLDQGRSRFAFIDWEFAQRGDCRWDLAALAVEFQLTQAQFQALCDSYQGVAKIADSRFFDVAKAWAYVYLITCIDWAYLNSQPYQHYLSLMKQHRMQGVCA